MLGCRIKIFLWEQVLLNLAYKVQESFKSDDGVQDEKMQISHVIDVTWRTATLSRADRHKHSDWHRMVGLSQK